MSGAMLGGPEEQSCAYTVSGGAEVRCSACEQQEDAGFVLIAPRLWDGLSDVCMRSEVGDVCVAVVGETIAWIGIVAELDQRYANLPRFEYDDGTIMPGLIDAHVHLEFDPRYALHQQPAGDPWPRMQQRARAMVAHGITAARDLGGNGSALGLRDAIARGECVGPRLVCSGTAITEQPRPPKQQLPRTRACAGVRRTP